MVTKLQATLFDAFEGKEELLEEIVADSVSKVLDDLGDRIFELEWANSNARPIADSTRKAA